MSTPALPDDHATRRARRITQVIREVIDQRRAIGGPADAEVVAAHPDLMPQLAGHLRALRQVEQAERMAECGGAGSAATSGSSAAGRSLSTHLPANFFAGYELIEEVYRGGQGIVYRAVQEATRREVAIKVLRDGPFRGPHDQMRFEREVRILAQLNHPNIVTIHDSGTASGSQYFAMDYVSGLPLDEYVASRPTSIRGVLALFVRICDAISAAHLRGVIHRDLKPRNVVVDDQGEPRILDFGLAKIATAELEDAVAAPSMTQTGQFLGSLPWASPEQAAGSPARIDVRSDVYALGVILYHMLTGIFPYPVTGQLHEVLTNILEASPIRPSTVRREIDGDVEAIILKCLAKEPERRYQGAAALAEDVRRCLDGRPVDARMPSAVYHVRKLIARHRLPAALLSALFVLATVSAIWTTVLYTRAERESQAGRAVNEFLVRDILANADPNAAPGRKLTVEEALARAAQRIDASFADQPAAKASVYDAIGRAYLGLGLYGEGEHHLGNAEAIRVGLLGEGHPDTVLTRVARAEAMTRAARFAEAESLNQHNLAAAAERLGSTHDAVFAAEQQYAETLWQANKLNPAAERLERVFETSRALFTADDTRRIAATVAWARNLTHLGRTAEAEAYSRSALEACRRTLGSDHTVTLDAVRNLGFILLVQNRPVEAEPLLVEACTGCMRLLGEQHPTTLEALNELALLHRNQERLADAESLYRQAVAVSTNVRGSDHPGTLAMQEFLGSVLQRRGKYAEAEAVFRVAVEGWRRTRGDDDVCTAQALDGRSYVLSDLGRFDEAEAGHRQAFEVKSRYYGAGSVNVLWSQRGLLRALVAQGRLDEARPVAEQLLAGRRRAAERPDADAYQLHCYARELLVIEPADLRDPPHAVEVAARVAELSPGDHAAHYLLARAWAATGDYARAAEEVRVAIALLPPDADEARTSYQRELESYLAALPETMPAEPLQPEPANPEAAHPEAAHPEAAGPEAVRPGPVQPVTVLPGSGYAEAVQPEPGTTE